MAFISLLKNDFTKFVKINSCFVFLCLEHEQDKLNIYIGICIVKCIDSVVKNFKNYPLLPDFHY